MKNDYLNEGYSQFIRECNKEPIHTPGTIQPLAILIAVDIKDFCIQYVSENLNQLFPFSPQQILGQPLQLILGPTNSDKLLHIDGLNQWQNSTVIELLLSHENTDRIFDALVYQTGDHLVLEIELDSFRENSISHQHFEFARDLLLQLDAENEPDVYLQKVVDLLRDLTGYDRVMMYQFHDNWDGEVIHESRIDEACSYLGNRFPASDIPSQARELYTKNLVRLIADIDASPTHILGLAGMPPSNQIDLTHSGCRSFSPVHIEYLRNMDVRATLTVSLLQNDKLWGLIALHHSSALYVPVRIRQFYDFLGKSISLKLLYLQTAERALHHDRIHASLSHLTWQIRQTMYPESIISSHSSSLLDLVKAGGGALCLAGKYHLFGVTPNESEIEALIGWLKTQQVSAVYYTNHLVEEYPPAEAFQSIACGMMVAPLNRSMTDFIIWFRPTVLKTVKWAGKPEKYVVKDHSGYRLSPRSSFTTWVESYQDRSEPWSAFEIDAANALTLAIIEVLNQSALKSSEANYRLLADHSTDMIIRIEEQDICSFISPSSDEILGYAPDEIVGKAIDTLIYEEDINSWKNAVSEMYHHQRPSPFLVRFKHQHGHLIWIESAINLLSNNKSGFIINARDVTQRHNYQLAIEELHKRQTQILDISQEGVISVDPEGRVVFVNETAGVLIGRDSSRMIGEMCFDVIQLLNESGEVFTREECPLLTCMHDRETYQVKNGGMRHAEGHCVEVEYVCSPLMENLQASGAVMVFEPVIKSHGQKNHHDTTHVILDQAEESVLIADAAGIITSVNRAFTKITGYTEAEALGKTPKLLKSGIHTPHFYNDLWSTLKNEGRWSGEIWNRRKNGEIYAQWGSISTVLDNQGGIKNYVAVFSDISKSKQAEQKLHYLANHDPLTDLPNRLQFTDHLVKTLEHAKRANARVAVIFLDLDRFKLINDSLGHQIGDSYLKVLASRLNGITRGGDFIARWGGDEFIFVYNNIKEASDIAEIAHRIMRTISTPVEVAEHEFTPTASIGISIYPDDADASHDLIKAADAAMYRAKDKGRNNFEFYTHQLTVQVSNQLDMAAELRRALKEEEFVLFYQPQCLIETAQVSGLEALIRWQHPDKGLLAPAAFLGYSHELGLMPEIGKWVVEQVCKDLNEWTASGFNAPIIAVNIDPAQITHQLADDLTNILDEYKIDPMHIELEITEGVLNGEAETIEILQKLKNLGFKLSVDDFGTGYSSLSHIKKFPISAFKIDKSFIDGVPTDKKDIAIINAIISLGTSLSVDLIAEGVETQKQYDYLKGTGVNMVQGYLFSKPLPKNEIQSFVKTLAITDIKDI